MLIHESMTRETKGVTGKTTVRQVLRLMVQHDVETLPIVDSNLHLLGCVTAHDLWEVVRSADEERLNTPIEQFACDAPSVCADETFESAAIILFERPWLEALAVMENDKVVGIVSRHNVLQSLACLTDQGWPRNANLQGQDSDAAGCSDTPDPSIYLG